MTIKTPCEIIVWELVPAIRSELAKKLIENHNLNQKEAAEKLGLTEAAVSRYLSGKRGDLQIPNGKITKEFEESCNRIFNGDKYVVIGETCRICEILKTQNILDGINQPCK